MKTPSNLISILKCHSLARLIESFDDGTFERHAPGCSKLASCDQRSKDDSHEAMIHMEGSVSVHTALVIVASRRIQLEDSAACYDDADLLAALLHDIEKPACRRTLSDGTVTFPGHEPMGAQRVTHLAATLGLDADATRKLCFLVENHGKAHELPRLGDADQRIIVGQPYWRNLRILQRADAESAWTARDDNPCGHMPVYWQLFAQLNEKFYSSAT